ncbi:MAG: DUF4097 family beta strand repeat-containing protein [Rhodothermales bacterium]|nr:DUF4097 family beta strand repeat-containing protein [Rhodothermales bacterium]
MRTKIVAAILCVLAALGLINVGQSIANRFLVHEYNHEHRHEHTSVHSYSYAQAETRTTTYVSTGDEVVVDQRFQVRDGGTLELSIGHADVNVETTGDGVATVRVTLSGRDLEVAREYFESLNFQARQDGNRIVVKTEPSRRNWNWRSNGGAEIDVHVVVPRRFNAEVSVAHGDLELGDLVGNLDVRSAHGDALVGSVDGDRVDITMAHGDLELGAVKANKVQFRTAHGDMTTGPVSAQELGLKAAHGDVDLDVRSGGTLEIVNTHGEINLTLGSSIGGSIRNSHGDIDIDAPDNLAANVEFHGDRIRLNSSYTFEGSQSKSRMEGRLNGGGPTLKAHTSFGSIAIN